jgi:hypothetical protein
LLSAEHISVTIETTTIGRNDLMAKSWVFISNVLDVLLHFSCLSAYQQCEIHIE